MSEPKLSLAQKKALLSLFGQDEPQPLPENTAQALVDRELVERQLRRGWGYGYVLTPAGRDVVAKLAGCSHEHRSG